MAHLAGPLDMGQIAVGCALGYLDFRHEARGWRAGRPALAAWFEAFDGRPAMAATRPA
jgi:glutathione S-transferase